MSSLLDELFSYQKSGKETAIALDRHFGHPHRAFPTIHIAGTNGKGSTAWKIASSLYGKVGLYTSPHIAHFRERIQINHRPIGDEALLRLLPPLLDFARRWQGPLSFFDLATTLAFQYFKEEKVDIAVIETGLGGRFDSTNVISPLSSVITSIGFDHRAILGDTLEEIAWQKGGIIKPNAPVILGPTANLPILRDLAGPLCSVAASAPFYDDENTNIARLALDTLGMPYDPRGLLSRPPCRFELVGDDLLFDVAHNLPGILRLLQGLAIHFPQRKLRFAIAISADKEIDSMLKALSPFPVHYVAVDHERLYPFVRRETIEEIWRQKEEGELLVITGTFFLMHHVKQLYII